MNLDFSISQKINFYSRPCGRGDAIRGSFRPQQDISTHAPAGGATRARWQTTARLQNFYSRPCGRGDARRTASRPSRRTISTHAPAGGATGRISTTKSKRNLFLLTPLREGRRRTSRCERHCTSRFLLTPLREGRRKLIRERTGKKKYFYSRPCGRGDCEGGRMQGNLGLFLLTPLREGRLRFVCDCCHDLTISTHAPAGGATSREQSQSSAGVFLLTPLREGRRQFSTSPS